MTAPATPTANTRPTRATFTNVTAGAKPFEVHFNPVSLQYSISNTLSRTGSGDSVKQHVSQATGTLTMELIFDTTDSGDDVPVRQWRRRRSHPSTIGSKQRLYGKRKAMFHTIPGQE